MSEQRDTHPSWSRPTTDVAAYFPPPWPTVLLTGAWRSLVALTLLVLDDELRGLLLRILLARRLQVFLYWWRSREYTNGSLAALL